MFIFRVTLVSGCYEKINSLNIIQINKNSNQWKHWTLEEHISERKRWKFLDANSYEKGKITWINVLKNKMD